MKVGHLLQRPDTNSLSLAYQAIEVGDDVFESHLSIKVEQDVLEVEVGFVYINVLWYVHPCIGSIYVDVCDGVFLLVGIDCNATPSE